jgi:hypothetical protein
LLYHAPPHQAGARELLRVGADLEDVDGVVLGELALGASEVDLPRDGLQRRDARDGAGLGRGRRERPSDHAAGGGAGGWVTARPLRVAGRDGPADQVEVALGLVELGLQTSELGLGEVDGAHGGLDLGDALGQLGDVLPQRGVELLDVDRGRVGAAAEFLGALDRRRAAEVVEVDLLLQVDLDDVAL